MYIERNDQWSIIWRKYIRTYLFVFRWNKHWNPKTIKQLWKQNQRKKNVLANETDYGTHTNFVFFFLFFKFLTHNIHDPQSFSDEKKNVIIRSDLITQIHMKTLCQIQAQTSNVLFFQIVFSRFVRRFSFVSLFFLWIFYIFFSPSDSFLFFLFRFTGLYVWQELINDHFQF